ncbi:MAG: hypothetical protein JRI94_01075 [Deltaproteobacteria bacterium]|nr:hypothetical protein [Deltaproteobacteria bacterium]MBW2113816.1 hypothetical protein [Deltaproteobacteria bacterium]
MLKNQMKDRIAEELKKAKEAGQITTEKTRDILRDAVSAAVVETKGGVEELRPLVKDAVAAAMEGLKDVGVDARETVDGVVEGAIAGARSRGDKAVEVAMQELQKLEMRLKDEKAMLAQELREGIEGSKEAGAILPEKFKGQVLSAVTDIKLKSTELLGLTKQTVKEAVKQAIESGKDVKDTVAQIASDATERALKEGRFSADRVKGIAGKVMSGAVEAAEEAGKEVKDVAAGAFEGAQNGIASAVESVGDKTKTFLREDLAKTKKDLKSIDDLFIETTRKVARGSRGEAKDVLNDLADQAKRTTSVLGKRVIKATESATQRVKQAGMDAAKTTAEATTKAADVMAAEAKELGKRTLSVARGAVSGMLKGAKEALKKEKED